MRTITTADGLALHLHTWPLPATPTRGSVLIVHGLGEHGGRYAHVAAHLTQAGWAVLGYDQRGHGRSGGPRGSTALTAAAPCAVLQSRCCDSLAHEVFNGPEQARVLADLTAGLSTMLRAAA